MKTLLLILVLSFTVFGQAKKPIAKPTPKQSAPIITIDAITSDGKAVILSSDGTWKYNSSPVAALSTVNIEAAIIYKSGDVKPVARTDFYLLPNSAESIIGTPELISLYKADAAKTRMPTQEKIEARDLIGALTKYQIVYPNYAAAAKEALSKVTSSGYKITTDFTGKGSFKNIPTGSYFLFGIAETQKSFAHWDMKVEVKGGEVNLALDQNNAASAY